MTEKNKKGQQGFVPFTLEPINIDFDKLFSLSYTFDNLKTFMNKLLSNQNEMTNKINELEKSLLQQKEENSKSKFFQIASDKKIKSLEQTISKLKNQSKIKQLNNEEIKDEEENEDQEKEGNKGFEVINKKGQQTEDKNEGQKFKASSGGNKNDYSYEEEEDENYSAEEYLMNSSEMKELKEKIENIEKAMEDINNKISENEKKQQMIKKDNFSIDNTKEDLDMVKLEIKSLSDRHELMKIEKDEMKKSIEDISIKVMDFNIYDLFKEASVAGGSIDAAKLLVMNLEQKFQKKTSAIDENIRKTNEDMYKLKNDFQNIKNQSDVITHNLDNFKDKIKELGEQVQKNNDINSNLVNEMGNKVNENYKKILQKFEEEKANTKKLIDKLKKQINSFGNKKEPERVQFDGSGAGLTEKDLQILTDVNKRISDLEKQMKRITSSIENSKTQEDLDRLDSEMLQKVNQKEFFELSDKLNMQTTLTNNIRDMVDRVQDISNKNMKDLNFFLKKIESLTAAVANMKDTLEYLSGMRQENIFDKCSFVETDTFKEFGKNYQKERTKMEKNIDELMRIVRDMADTMKAKAGEEDLKNFEQLITNKLDEMKLMCGRKFADKIDTSKNLKYMDSQIKHIIEVYIKKGDKSESWLLAKKPVGGFACASCEAYLGDLKDKGEYIPWNKYPQREKDKNYRVGNGFSRMLNMLNLDIKNSIDNIKEQHYESDEDPCNYTLPGKSPGNISNIILNTKSNVLPKITASKGEENGTNNSSDGGILPTEPYKTSETQKSGDNKNPHIVKVYRKTK